MVVYLTLAKLQQKQTRPMFIHKVVGTTLPTSVDFSAECPARYNQGNMGSCTSNAFCMNYLLQERDKSFKPSRLYFYYKERLAEDEKHDPKDITDSGADVVDGITWVQHVGICSEESWPYIEANVNKAPPMICDLEAVRHKVKSYAKITVGDLNTIKATLAKKVPVLLAIGVYKSFESDDVAATGLVPIPTPDNYEDTNDPTDPFLGGHEMLIVGYDDIKQLFTVCNSWGEDWGDKGFCYIPYDYITNTKLCYELVYIQC